MKRLIGMVFVLVLVLGACGGSEGGADSASGTDAPTTTQGPTTTEATSSPETSTTTVTSTTTDVAGANVAVTLSEWAIESDVTIAAGEVTFDVTNASASEFNHEFAIIAAETYDELPKLDNGAVDEAALADGQFLGRTERLEPGQAETITFDLEPGNYVFLCNIHFGPNSHAAAGQTLAVTVNP